jgi:hypothetical protein
MNRPEGVTLVSIYHYVEAGLSLLGACLVILVPVITGLALATEPATSDASVALTVTIIIAIVAVIVLLLVAAANAAVGWGLWQMKPWARLGAVVLSCLRLLSIPIGTIIGGVTLWYLFRPEVRAAFGEETAAQS